MSLKQCLETPPDTDGRPWQQGAEGTGGNHNPPSSLGQGQVTPVFLSPVRYRLDICDVIGAVAT